MITNISGYMVCMITLYTADMNAASVHQTTKSTPQHMLSGRQSLTELLPYYIAIAVLFVLVFALGLTVVVLAVALRRARKTVALAKGQSIQLPPPPAPPAPDTTHHVYSAVYDEVLVNTKHKAPRTCNGSSTNTPTSSGGMTGNVNSTVQARSGRSAKTPKPTQLPKNHTYNVLERDADVMRKTGQTYHILEDCRGEKDLQRQKPEVHYHILEQGEDSEEEKPRGEEE
jgi:hypothetical protein